MVAIILIILGFASCGVGCFMTRQNSFNEPDRVYQRRYRAMIVFASIGILLLGIGSIRAISW